MARALKIVLVRKRGTRKDGRNYVATCTICSGARSDVSYVLGVDRAEAQRLADKHCVEVHAGHKTI